MTTREAWLLDAIDHMRPMFRDQGKPLPDQVHVSIGFGSKRKHIGECWSPQASKDARHHIFVSPIHRSDLDMLGTLAHELCHAALPPQTKHRAPFQRLAAAIGLQGPWIATTSGPALQAALTAILAEIGPSPHATLNAANMPKKQKTRLRLFECECGVKVRVARDTFDATCNLCDSPFINQSKESDDE